VLHTWSQVEFKDTVPGAEGLERLAIGWKEWGRSSLWWLHTNKRK